MSPSCPRQGSLRSVGAHFVARIVACLLIGCGLAGCATTAPASSDGDRADVVTAELETELAAELETFALLREAADHEALFTLVGGLKPMSTGIWRGSFAVDDPDLTELRQVRASLAPLRTDRWYADVQVFDAVYDGERSMDAYVVHRAAMRRMIQRTAWFWSAWGITPCTPPSVVIAVVDRMPRADRWRGYGYLFGFPDDAVAFFVTAGLAAQDGGEIGPGKDRQFVDIPTYAAATGAFTYAVPIDHLPSDADVALADTARRILAAYTERVGRMRDTTSMITELRRLDDRFGADGLR